MDKVGSHHSLLEKLLANHSENKVRLLIFITNDLRVKLGGRFRRPLCTSC